MELLNSSVNVTNYFDVSKITFIYYVTAVLYFMYGVVTVLGNIVLIVAMSKQKLLQIGGFLTLAHYAIPDIIGGTLNIVYVPWSILLQSSLLPGYIPGLVLTFGEFSRKVFIVFMAVTAFWAVMSPMSASSTMSIVWYKKALLLTWGASALASMPFWVTKYIYFDYQQFKWSFNRVVRAETQFNNIYGATINSIVTVIILVAYPVCFFKLVRPNYFRKNAKVTGNSNSTANRNQIAFRQRSILYLFVLNAVIFMLYWIPIYLVELFKVFIPFYGLYIETIRGIQTAYNPIAYWILNKNIRLAINGLIFCGQHDNKVKLDNNSRALSATTGLLVTGQIELQSQK